MMRIEARLRFGLDVTTRRARDR